MAIPKQQVIRNVPGAPAQPEGDSLAHRRLLQLADDRFKLVTISDKVAGDVLHTRDYKWDFGNREFPETIDAHMRFVTKYYPYTKGLEGGEGPLLVDEPRTEREVREAYVRQKILWKRGIRHIVVEPRRPDPENEGKYLEGSTLDDCLRQLEEMRAVAPRALAPAAKATAPAPVPKGKKKAKVS